MVCYKLPLIQTFTVSYKKIATKTDVVTVNNKYSRLRTVDLRKISSINKTARAAHRNNINVHEGNSGM